MMVLVIGGSGSGKSAYAEEITLSLSARQACYYLATMQVLDKEGRQKADRHRALRIGKGFLTIEQPAAIHKSLEKMKAGGRTVLLECIANLTANEMFAEEEPLSEIQVTETVMSDIEQLKEKTTHLVVVSNNVFEDGIVYSKATTAYIRAMGMINRKLAAMADQVVEVAAGIPIVIKQQGDG